MQVPVKYLNAYRNVKGRLDLLRFLFRWDSDYRKDLLITILAFMLLGYSIYDLDDWMDLVAMAVEITIIMLQLGTEMSVLPRDYRPSYGGVRYTVQTSTHIAYEELSFLMSGVYPPVVEEMLGFHYPMAIVGMSRESPLVSPAFDDTFMLKRKITYRNDVQDRRYIRSRHQIRYIAIRVADKLQHTTNGVKLALQGTADTLLSGWPVPLRKSYYFDALLTAEAFRSRIFRNNIDGQKELYTDLTTYFPVYKETVGGQECVRFTDDFHERVSGHVGITSLLLTENRRVAMLFQGSTKAIGSRTVSLGGSGSLDYADMQRAGHPEDLRELLAAGMAREVAEETGLAAHVKEIKDNTLVIGFFRWIDRCGKPEFVGVTRAGSVDFAKNQSIDGDEVIGFEEIPITVDKLEDFIDVLKYVRDNDINVSLSSLMALYRLVVVARYNRSGKMTETQRKVYDRISSFLFEGWTIEPADGD
jgi:hypothetical protein